jgi:predicted transcriptional regulator
MAKKLSREPSTLLFGNHRTLARVFDVVCAQDAPKNISDIARTARMNRTTVSYLIRSLLTRGLIEKVGTKKHPLYQKTPQEKLLAMCEAFLKKTYSEVSSVPHYTSTNSSIRFYAGERAIFSLWKEIASLPRFTRVRGIQPDASFHLALTHLHKVVSYEDMVQINRSIDMRKIIMEDIVHEKTVDTVHNTIVALGESPIPFLKSFGSRAADVAKLPDGFLDVPAELYIFQNTVILIHWPEDYALRIENKAVARFFLGLFESLKYLCTRYDQNERAAQKVLQTMARE